MNSRVIFAVLLIAAIGLIAVYVLDVNVTGGGGTAVDAGTNDSGGEQVSGEATVINVDQEIERTKHLQESRKKIMDGMIEGGLASRIENPAGEPFIYVLEPFYLLTVDEQTSLLNVILYYYMTQDRDSDVLSIYNEDTGQEIGTYTPSGLLMGE
jgi:hypothetical protein